VIGKKEGAADEEAKPHLRRRNGRGGTGAVLIVAMFERERRASPPATIARSISSARVPRSPNVEEAPALPLIPKIGVGVNTIDLAAARPRGVAVSNTSTKPRWAPRCCGAFSGLGHRQPLDSIILRSRQQRIAVAQAVQKRDPGAKPPGVWRMWDEGKPGAA
jgi:hypothetical protein